MLKCLVLPNAKAPTKNFTGDAGWDLYAFRKYRINPHERMIIQTGVKVSCPENIYFRIADKSGTATKKGLHVLAGVIDSTYRGEIKILVLNMTDRPVFINRHEAIAQMIPTVISQEPLYLVERLEETERAESGGINK